MKKAAILFDFDGVIAYSEHLYQKVEQQLFDRHGITLSDDEWAGIKGISADKFFALVREKYIPDADPVALRKETEVNLLRTFKEELEYVAGFEALFPLLRERYAVGIVTATGRKIMEWIFSNTHVKPEYDILITADDVNNSKPHPEPYLTAAERLGFPVTSCLVIEDSINGLRSGKAAGAKVLALSTSLHPSYLKDADRIYRDFTEISLDDIRELIS